MAYTVLSHITWITHHPDHLFLLEFARSQLATTLVLVIIFGPKVKMNSSNCCRKWMIMNDNCDVKGFLYLSPIIEQRHQTDGTSDESNGEYSRWRLTRTTRLRSHRFGDIQIGQRRKRDRRYGTQHFSQRRSWYGYGFSSSNFQFLLFNKMFKREEKQTLMHLK